MRSWLAALILVLSATATPARAGTEECSDTEGRLRTAPVAHPLSELGH